MKHGSFLATVHREMSVALCKGNRATSGAAVQLYSGASGHMHLQTAGLLSPSAEVQPIVHDMLFSSVTYLPDLIPATRICMMLILVDAHTDS
jgi:hypothetical protein